MPDSAFGAFSNWAEGHLTGDSVFNPAQGEALSWKRQQAMLELIESDPERALALAVPFRWRRDLPSKVTRYFEHRVDGRGEFQLAMAENFRNGQNKVYRWAIIDGHRFDAFIYGRRLAQSSRSNIPLHGIVIENKLALQSDPIRVLDLDEAAALEQENFKIDNSVCRVCGQPTDSSAGGLTGDIGGEVAAFCSGEHLQIVNDMWVSAEGAPGDDSAGDAAGGGDTFTQGRKTVLYMRVNFPDDLTEPISETAAHSTMDAVNDFYVEGSYNSTWLTTTVTPLLTVPRTKAWYSTAGPGALLDDARAVSREAGYETANYDWDIVAHTGVPDFDWGGLGFVHGKGTWLQSHGAGVTAHELGHNYGLLHGNFWNTMTNGSVIGPGTNVEYGNIFDTMGAAAAGNNHFGAYYKNVLGWLPNAVVHDIRTNGVYRIHPFDVPGRINGWFYAAKVRKDFDRDYWLEFRHLFAGNPSMQNGLLLNWDPWAETDGTSLLDTTPETPARDDSAVVIGRTFSDPVAGVHITPLERNPTGPDPWIDVRVNLGNPPDNWPPFLEVEADPTNAAPGELVHFHATAWDLDGDALAYAWTFDDLTFSTNNQPWTAKSWNESGEHVVRCVVSDMKGGSASANVIVTVGGSTGFRVSGIVLDPNGDPVEGVRIDNGITNGPPNFSSHTDSDGRFILVGVDSFIQLEATKYGYAFTNLTWFNPLFLGGDFTGADFLAEPLTSVSLRVTTNRLTENNGAAQQLTLTRTGDPEEELPVALFISGTANVPGDLSFSPTISNGQSEVIIPAGSNQVSFAFSAVNNSTVEPTEFVSVTILEGEDYVIAPLGEVAITILDDDSSSPPAVAVSSRTSLVSENGADRISFVFTRMGGTSGDLPVFYTFGGSATAGADYPTPLGVVIIPTGQTTGTVEFPPTDDKDVEPDETVSVSITPNATYSIAAGSAAATIVDDDLLVVTVSPSNGGLAEPSTSGRFTIQRDGDLSANLLVAYSMSGTASNGVDYVAPSGTVTIPAGAASADVIITALDDALLEGDESVILVLKASPVFNVGPPGTATLWLRDDERTTVSIFAPDESASEPGSDFGSFQISRGSVVNGDLTVALAISGTAIGGADYLPLDNEVTIPNGSSSLTLEVIPFDDLHLEPAESIILKILPGTNYNVGIPDLARVTLVDDESFGTPAVGFSLSASGAPESESPGISVSLSATSSSPVLVSYKVIGGTASPGDYSLPGGLLTILPGERARSIPLIVNDDSTVEADETIRVTLYDPVNATHDGIRIHTYTIVDNDTCAVSVTATGATASETGPVAGNFRITRTGSTSANQLVNYQITGTASAPSDHPSLGTSITIPAGATFVDLPVVPVNDGTVELDETVVLTLISAPDGRIVSPGSAAILITDNDPNGLPVVTVSSTNSPHAVEGGGNGAFVFTRSGSTNNPLVLSLALTGQAGNNVDYLAIGGTATIPAGQFSVAIPVVAVDDSQVEGEETVLAALTARDTYRVGYSGTATVIIQDNDQNVRVNASDLDASEPGTNPGGFVFTRFGTTNTALRVFFTLGGDAGNGVDYANLPNSLTIPAGSLSAVLPVVPLDDPLVEGPEIVTLTLQNAAAYSLSSPTTATVIIDDDEPMFTLSADLAEVIEGTRVPAVLTVHRTGNPEYEVTARLSVGGTASFGVDYPAFATNVFFRSGVVGIDLPIYPTNELAIEGVESITAELIPDPSYTILSPSNVFLNILDAGENATPMVNITSPTAEVIYLLGTNVNMILESTVTDDGDTNFPPYLTWTNVSGPVPVTFGELNQTNTTVGFTNGGVYVLRLIADDFQLQSFAEITVLVDTLGRLSTNALRWTFDEGSGANVSDSSGNSRDGVLTGIPNWTPNGIDAGALALAGTNDLVREAVPSGFLNGLKQFSLSLWLKAGSTNTDLGILTADESGSVPTLTLSSRTAATSGSSSNVIEATLATVRGGTRHISASNSTTNGWQHLALTWSNSLAPALFLNGHLDQPFAHMVPVKSILTNCPQFTLGRGPADLSNSWRGLIDDVRVFNRALEAVEAGAFAATNHGAFVEVPTNIVVPVLTPVELYGIVTDDGRPIPPGALSNTWVQVSGPVTMTLTNANALTNTLEFTQSGEYVFRLIADDGQVKVFDDVTVTVIEPTTVYAFVHDGEAAELGPDTGEIAFSRFGDLNFDLTIDVEMSGTASNGVDVEFITLTNAVTLNSGVDTVSILVSPYLDHRTEGDETLTYTIISNVTYTIGSSEATVTIHDSPYGQWNIAHFTLEELTDPSLSGEGVDFEHDRLLNFVEYTANRDPKAFDTNAIVAAAIEPDPMDGLNHVTVAYTRRLPPTDAAYEVAISGDLKTWYSGTNHVREIETIDDGNGLTETVRARLLAPWPAGSNQFVTVRVWLQTTQP